MDYFIDYERIKKEIVKSKAKRVLVQLPDGLKKDYQMIEKGLSGDYELYFWLGTCFGACDIPVFAKDYGFDFIVHLGHEEFVKEGI
jgi:2-(3-amino-3-carboxypropyl)histidine synthase